MLSGTTKLKKEWSQRVLSKNRRTRRLANGEVIKKAIIWSSTEATKAAVLAMIEVNEGSRMPTTNIGQAKLAETARNRVGRTYLRQPIFHWVARDWFVELKHFKVEVYNILVTKHYTISDTGNVPIIKKIDGDRRTAIYSDINTTTRRILPNCCWIK